MKQTAVGLLIQNIVEDQTIKAKSMSEWIMVFEKVKEMEKEQKLECWNVAHQAGRFEGKGIAEENWQTFEQYYNQTYKSE
jgi:hypothetical protein